MCLKEKKKLMGISFRVNFMSLRSWCLCLSSLQSNGSQAMDYGVYLKLFIFLYFLKFIKVLLFFITNRRRLILHRVIDGINRHYNVALLANNQINQMHCSFVLLHFTNGPNKLFTTNKYNCLRNSDRNVMVAPPFMLQNLTVIAKMLIENRKLHCFHDKSVY